MTKTLTAFAAISALQIAAVSVMAQTGAEKPAPPPSTSPASPTSPGAVVGPGTTSGSTSTGSGSGAINGGIPGEVAFEALDTDRDGGISVTEANFAPALARGFRELDANRDGKLTPAEFANWRQR